MQIFGIQLDILQYKEFFQNITKLEKQNIIFTPNPEILLKTKQDKAFKDLLLQANYLTPDGIGLYIGFQILSTSSLLGRILLLPYYFFNLFFRRKYLYKKYGERICGSDITKDLIDFAQTNNIKVSIIDLYNPTDLKKVESQKVFPQILLKKFPKLRFNYFVYDPKHKEEIIKKIQNSESQMLFSTLGMKKQEQSVIEIMSICKNIKIGLGIGSSFDYFIGFQKRAPKIFRSIGLEWFYRIFTGPKKIERLKRIYNAIFRFTFEVFKEKK